MGFVPLPADIWQCILCQCALECAPAIACTSKWLMELLYTETVGEGMLARKYPSRYKAPPLSWSSELRSVMLDMANLQKTASQVGSIEMNEDKVAYVAQRASSPALLYMQFMCWIVCGDYRWGIQRHVDWHVDRATIVDRLKVMCRLGYMGGSEMLVKRLSAVDQGRFDDGAAADDLEWAVYKMMKTVDGDLYLLHTLSHQFEVHIDGLPTHRYLCIAILNLSDFRRNFAHAMCMAIRGATVQRDEGEDWEPIFAKCTHEHREVLREKLAQGTAWIKTSYSARRYA